ncbi:unnamed protein product [Lactuca saligna]|uniref:Uncharacterized protein n=1 Tax=Lactuca saligna TaxID=75948 RepID=A0AA35ZBV5_LACSI|nr:unnamed protein product [Lactuca saligna]
MLNRNEGVSESVIPPKQSGEQDKSFGVKKPSDGDKETEQPCKTTELKVNLAADLPCLNPYDWIMLIYLLMKEEKKYESVVDHIKRMLVSYTHEVAKMDVEIPSVLRKKPTVLPKSSVKDIEKMKLERIEKEN